MSSSLLSILQDWLRNDRTGQQNHLERQDYEQMVKLVGEYQQTMLEYQHNMNTYLLLLATLQTRLHSPSQPNPQPNPQPNQNRRAETEETPLFSTGSMSPRTQSTRVFPRSVRRNNVRSSNPLNNLRPLITRYQPSQNNRSSESTLNTTTIHNETTRLFDTLVRENRGMNNSGDSSGNRLNTENPWISLFSPSLSSSNGNSIFRDLEQSTDQSNMIDIVFEYDEQLQNTANPESALSLRRMIQSDDFRNQILRAAGINNQSNVLRWIVAPNGLEESEQRGLTMEEIRECTESLVYSEGMEGLLSTVCPITMEEYVAGDRLLQLRECRHAFHERELVEWFQRHDTCPVCRNRVVE